MKAMNLNVSDIANMIYSTDYANLKSFRAIVMTKSDTCIYIPTCGVWKEQKGDEEVRNIIKRFMVILEREIIDRIQVFISKIKLIPEKERTPQQNEELELLERKATLFTKLYGLLGDNKQDSIIKHLLHRIVMETKYYDDFKHENFNNAEGFIAFDDGVLDIAKGELIPEQDALQLLFTQTVGYNYEDVKNVDQEVKDACWDFLCKVLPDGKLRDFLLRRYNRAFSGIVEKLILILYNKKGNNGKTKLLELLERALGDSYVKCNAKLLYPETLNSSSGANEDLMSIKNALIVAFSEPDANKTLNMALLKELSGGDTITGRKLYKGKERYKAKGLINIACNHICSMNASDASSKATFNRIRCIPFESEFTTDEALVNEQNNVYLADESISKYFDEWKYAFMNIVLSYHDKEVKTPDKVLEHTRNYQKREDALTRFFTEHVVKVDDQDKYITQNDLYATFKDWAKDEQVYYKKSNFIDDIKGHFEKDSFKSDTTIKYFRVKNVWKGYSFSRDVERAKEEQEIEEHDDID